MADELPSDIGAFPAVLNARLAADARIAKTIAFCWFGVGFAGLSVLAGLGVVLALYGFSFVLSPVQSADLVAKSFVAAIAQSKMKTTVHGTMEIAPGTELSLAKDQIVSLAANATLKIDPDSSIRVVGDFKVDVPQPSKQQLQIDAVSSSKETPFTRYTVFKSARVGSGNVVTGWVFELADPLNPSSQYCYYSEMLANNVSVSQAVGKNGLPLRPSALNKLTFDFDTAYANCFWYSG